MITPHGLAAAGRRMNISTMSLNLTERSSTANMSLSDLSGIQIADMVTSWFLDDEQPGKNIVWRARNISRAYHSDTSTIQLEHIINVLRDTIIFGEVKTEDISAWAGKDKKAKKVSARDAVRYALHFQNDWVLGTFDYDDEVNPYAFDGDTVYDALEYVSASLEDAFWSYDMTTYPFTLNITNNNASKLPKNSQSIMRAGRNLNTITRNIDKSGMYTRFYATGKDDLKMEFGKDKTPYRDRNTTKYGIIEHAENDNSLTTQEQLQFWALTKLRKHDAPVVTIDVDGLELADATGESVDRFTLGMLCRVPLPEFSTTIEEKIVGLSYSDKKNQPESVKVSLSNKREDVTKIIAQQTQAARRSSRVQQRQNKSTMEIVRNTIKAVQIAGPDKNNQYKLQYKLVTDTDWKDAPVNFSRAVTSWTVKANSGKITVTAKPQEQSKDIYVRQGPATLTGNIYTGKIQYSENGTAWASSGAEYTVNATERYTAGFNDGDAYGFGRVTVTSVALKDGEAVLPDTGVRETVPIEGTAENGKTRTSNFKLSKTKYTGSTLYCVNLTQYNSTSKKWTDIIGRIDTTSVYTEGWNDGNEAGQGSVTVTKVALASNLAILGPNDIRVLGYIQGTASNGATKSNDRFWLARGQYIQSGATKHCVMLRQDHDPDRGTQTASYDDILRMDATPIYSDGFDAGVASVTVTKVALAANYPVITGNDTRAQMYIQGTASNGNTKTDARFWLVAGTYNTNKHCVELRQDHDADRGTSSLTYDIIGRLDATSIYNAGAESVTVAKVALADNYSLITGDDTRAQMFIQGTASNGAKKTDARFWMVASTYGSGSLSRHCVELRQDHDNDRGYGPSYDIIGRLDATSIFNAGANSVTVTKVALADNYTVITGNDTRIEMFIQGTASNGNKKTDSRFWLVKTTYNSGKHCVELRQTHDPARTGSETYDIIGRIDATTIYKAGADSVTVTKVALADNYSYLGNTDTRYQIYIQGTASNGAYKNDALFQLAATTYGAGSGYCVNLRQGNHVIGRIDTSNAYNAGSGSVTVTKVALADNLSVLGNSDTRVSGIYIQGTASNNKKKTDSNFWLVNTTYSGGSCVELRQQHDADRGTQSETYDIIGRIAYSNLTASNIELYANGTSDITIQPTQPSGTSLSSLAGKIMQAINGSGGKYVKFPATLSGGTGTKWYYLDFSNF